MEELEKAFAETAKLLLGTELHGLDGYSDWIMKRVPSPYTLKSAFSGKEVWVPPPLIYLDKKFNPSRVISLDEMDDASASPFTPDDLENSTVNEMLAKFVKPVAFFCGNFRYPPYENVEKCSGAGAGRNIYCSEDVYLDVTNVAFSYYALYCKNMFGCCSVKNSAFCIHVYNSVSVNRCFEVDGCSNSSDLFFCHNCENMRDSMFCFNAKNMKNAIGNVPLPPKEYREIKSSLLQQLSGELEKTKSLRYDIYNIGCPKVKK